MTSLKNNFQCTNQLSSGFYFDLVGGGLNLNFSSKVYLLGYLNYCNLENAPKYSHFFFYYFHSLVTTRIFIFIPMHKLNCILVSHGKPMFFLLSNGPHAQVLSGLYTPFCISGTARNY